MARVILIGIVLILIVAGIAVGATLWKKKELDRESRKYLAEGLSLYEEGKKTEASVLFQNIVSDNPSFEEADHARYLLGVCLAETDPAKSKENWRQIIDKMAESDFADDARIALANLELASDPASASQLITPLLGLHTDTSDDALFLAAKIEEARNQTEKARRNYYSVIEQYPGSNSAGPAYDRLSEINTQLLYSNRPTDFTERYAVERGDVPLTIGNKFETTAYLIEALNGLEGRSMRIGQNIMVPKKGGIRIVIDMDENWLYVYQAVDGLFLKRYRIGSTAYRERTPPGQYKILEDGKMLNPKWYPTRGGKPIEPGDPANPLGTRWMGFDKQYHLGIHGTNDPDSIGQSVSEGCIRMHNKDVEELFMLARIGTPIEILE